MSVSRKSIVKSHSRSRTIVVYFFYTLYVDR